MMSSSVHPACSSFVAQNPDGRELGLAGEPDPISRLEGGWRHGPAREDDAANRGGDTYVWSNSCSCSLFSFCGWF